MSSVQAKLLNVQVGDIVHGTYPSAVAQTDGSAICLVVDIVGDEMHTRQVTTQAIWVFDRRTGIGNSGSSITSVARLPSDIHDALLGLDMRYRSHPDDVRLRAEERDAILFISDFYPANPLADEDDAV